MKKSIVLFMLLCLGGTIYAQFDAQTAFYMNFNSLYNPAAAGEGRQMLASGSYRVQWVGINNAPRTAFFQAQLPVITKKTEQGIGLRFMNDQVGLFANRTAHLQYAYKFKLGKGRLSAGAELGFVSLTFEGDSVHIPNLSGDDYHNAGDRAVPLQKVSAMKPDLGLGVYYRSESWQAGVSYSHVTRPKLLLTDESEFSVFGTLYVLGSYTWMSRSRNFGLSPSLLLRSDFSTWTLDMALLGVLKERFKGGLTYRWGDAVGLLLTGNVVGNLSVGYAYELPVSRVLQASSGSHEVYLSYALDIYRQKRTSKYKSVRFL